MELTYMTANALFESDLTSIPLIQRGKVRDIYAIDDQHMLIVASDRMSAFDVILPTPIAEKGAILTSVSNFWFSYTQNIIQNHLSDMALSDVLTPEECEQVAGRAVIVRKLKPLPVEAIVRGYIVGSGWKDYQATGAICGIHLPEGLQQADKLEEPIYTPSSKAAVGDHDENISYEATEELLGKGLAAKVRDVSLAIYKQARDYAAERGIIIADTKFEFGLDEKGDLVLIDEVLTPDSSRFWPADEYKVGISPPSFDKQIVRDYLETLDWDKTAPGPELPESVVENTVAKYREAQQRLTES